MVAITVPITYYFSKSFLDRAEERGEEMTHLSQSVQKALESNYESSLKPGRSARRNRKLDGLPGHLEAELMWPRRTYQESEMADCQEFKSVPANIRPSASRSNPSEKASLWYCEGLVPSITARSDGSEGETWLRDSNGASWVMARRQTPDGGKVAALALNRTQDTGAANGKALEGILQAREKTAGKGDVESPEKESKQATAQRRQSSPYAKAPAGSALSAQVLGVGARSNDTDAAPLDTVAIAWISDIGLSGYSSSRLSIIISLYLGGIAALVFLAFWLLRGAWRAPDRTPEEMNKRVASLWEAFRRGVFHDMRNEISPIKHMAEEIDDPALRRRVQAKTQESLDILNDMTSFDYLGIVSQRLEKTDVAALVKSVIADIHPEPDGSEGFYRGPDRLNTVCRRTALLRAITNAAVNAEKHGGGLKEIGVDKAGRDIVITVKDDGPGIHADQRERLLEPFERAVPSARGKRGGSGLGMWIMTEMMDCHGGKVELQGSEGGRGLTVRLILPSQLKADR